MKHWTIVLVAVVWGFGSYAEENSILYPKQIQPKLTFRQRCKLGKEWRRYGSMRECIEELRHEELVELQKQSVRKSEEQAVEAAREREQLREEARERYGWEMLHRSLEDLRGNSP